MQRPHCRWAQVPAEVLQWKNRATPLLEEILEADADLIALQEVNHFGASDQSDRS